VIGAFVAIVGNLNGVAPSNLLTKEDLATRTLLDLWGQWKLTYAKSYASPAEEMLRFSRFEDNYRFISEWNADTTQTSSVGLNQFADLNTAEFKALKGCLNMPQPTLEEVEESRRTEVNYGRQLQNPPATWDWRTKGAVTPVKNQGDCGSCWAFSTTGTLEGLNFITNKNLLSFSEQQLVDCSGAYGNMGCDGGWPFWALQYTEAQGIELESTYPYTGVDGNCNYNKAQVKFQNTGYGNVTKMNEVALAQAVVTQPISVCVEADQPVFQLYTGGIISSASCGTQLDHAILAVGYGVQGKQDYWIIKNSWGASWGLQGYLYILKTSSTNTNGICGVAMNPAFPTN
jgi:cathepsin L